MRASWIISVMITACVFVWKICTLLLYMLGTNGGAVCLDPGNALRRGILHSQLVNGAAGPGTRPVIADSRVVQGQKIIMEIYCPDTLAAFQQVVADLRFAEVAS